MNKEEWTDIIKKHQPQDVTPVISDHRTKMMLKQLESLIEGEPKRILEVGFGDGWFMNELKKKFPNAEIVGITVVQPEKDRAKQLFKIPDENLYVGDMHELPFKDGSFDLIIHRDVFEHSIAPYIFLKEMQRVLVDKGKVIMGYPSAEWRNFEAHYSVLDPDQFCLLAQKAGLAVKNIFYKVWMFWGMTFGYRSWVWILSKDDDWYYETEDMYDQALLDNQTEMKIVEEGPGIWQKYS